MSLLLHIIVTCIKENIIIKLQNLYSPSRSPRAGNKSPTLFIERPGVSFINYVKRKRILLFKACCGEVWMFRNMRLILFDIFHNPSFKMMTSFANVARRTASTSLAIY